MRRERPHQGAQLRFDDVGGYRLTAFATNTKVGQLADLEVRLSCTGWGGLCFRVGFFVGILGVGWLFRGTKAAVGSGG